MHLHARHHRLVFPRRPLVMGIININDDSFCNDGSLDAEVALNQAQQQLLDGAEIIDIGAESARTNREPISIEEEVRRLHSFIKHWPELVKNHPTDSLLSINTWRPEVVEQVLPHGGDILNDISALPDDRNARQCAKHGVALLIMHSVGQPKVAHTHLQWPDIMQELDQFFDSKIQLALAAGVQPEQIILDPGIDFAKQRDDNLAIYRHLEKLHRFERPILLPVSRKTVIGQVLELADPLERDAGTVACIAAGMRRGAHLFRVHHVAAAVQTVKTLHAVCSVDGSH